ncbi:MAG TPA: dihydroorotate dehydrogenase electron transfer subunit [Candidatus Omnitrophota bacterium]|nr:dihydroorotate dehydrogenase electron transfer subunit [Candidatus Omnitrophota bacterium]
MIQENCRVLDQTSPAPGYYKLTLSSGVIARQSVPGQFVNIKVSEGIVPLLRRPISIHHADPEKGTLTLLYETIGTGTDMLSKKPAGAEFNLLGPLGNGFDREADICILVAGGMGIAPLGFLAQTALKQKKDVYFFIGAKTEKLVLCEKALSALGAKVTVATEDGSRGEKGLVTASLEAFLKSFRSSPGGKKPTIYSCGPRAMLRAVATVAKQNEIDCQVSMEAYMACGIGACKGCPVETGSGYRTVCKDGPVFDAREIKWE